MANNFDHRSFLNTTPEKSGVYQMHDGTGVVLYVGKAKNLKKRLSSYFRSTVDPKTKVLVDSLTNITITVTPTENEALLLEHNLIKKYRPKYNVLLRDDKSYPYIFISDHQHPRISTYRGPKKRQGHYFGPYPSTQTVRDSLYLLQKIFQLRSCSDHVYLNRKRPCLLYQLKRCCGPCVTGLVSDDAYKKQVKLATLFLKGKEQQVIDTLFKQMQQASEALQFEKAAILRDQIQSIGNMRAKQAICADINHHLDVIGIAQQQDLACVHHLMIREGRICSSHSYFPFTPQGATIEEIIRAFLLQFYLPTEKTSVFPAEILINQRIDDLGELTQALSEIHQKKIKLTTPARGYRQRFTQLATDNAKSALETKFAHTSTFQKRLRQLEKWLDLQSPITQMACIDISHTQGECTVASYIVFGRESALTSNWRRYNIDNITPGDDYAAMEQVIGKHFCTITQASQLPDILFIDGGKGQLMRVKKVLSQLLTPQGYSLPLLIGVAKGVSRKPGYETLFINDPNEQYQLDKTSPVLHLIQYIRDESHRFAISGHRQRRGKTRITSTLEQVPGIGKKRRQALLAYLGGLQGVKKATVEAMTQVPGISETLALKIYTYLHDNKH